MPHVSEPELLVLHSLRLRGFASAEAISEHTGVDACTVEGLLAAAAAAQRARHRDGRVTGWSLTAAGREHLAELLLAEGAATGATRVLTSVYTGFLVCNEELKLLCTDWQLGEHDPTCISRLGDLHVRAAPLARACADLLDRFARYELRLTAALSRLQAGDTDAFTKPMSGSYHDVWMELHEDLLATLGRSRTAEDGH